MKEKIVVEGRYIRQCSSFDHFAVVTIEFSTTDKKGILFENALEDKQFPSQFIFGVKKGLALIEKEYKITNIKAKLIDAWYQEYDSKEMDFEIAAVLAFKKVHVQIKNWN